MRAKVAIPPEEILKQYSDIEYLCYTIAFHAAPTIMRQKAASLIIFKNGSRPLKQVWLENKERCTQYFPMRFFCLYERPESVGILFYQEDLLAECLKKQETKGFLACLGYAPEMSLNEKLVCLARRYRAGCPHEIGVFLDYPLHDVKAFADCRKDCLLTGYWKVYAEEKTALKRFREFDHSKNRILQALLGGVSPKRVAYV